MPAIADINHGSFSLPSVGAWYARQHGFEPDEEAIGRLLLLRNGRVKNLLDLGVGAGRTVEPMREMTENYVGLDFSEVMIAKCRERYPSTDFRVGDARDLMMFDNASFDLVFFSYNGIDYVDHPGRMKILAEVRRVLRPNGVFWFSSHNRDAPVRSLWRGDPTLPLTSQARQFVWFVSHLPFIIPAKLRHLYMRRYEVRTGEYQIKNDDANAYRLLTYYIDAASQVAQLNISGFCGVEVFDHFGNQLVTRDDRSSSPWLNYVGRKRP